MSWFSKKEFNFSDYISEELGFKKDIHKIKGGDVYFNNNFTIIIQNTKQEKGYDEVEMFYDKESIFAIKFIPNSSLITQCLYKQSLLTSDVLRGRKEKNIQEA